MIQLDVTVPYEPAVGDRVALDFDSMPNWSDRDDFERGNFKGVITAVGVRAKVAVVQRDRPTSEGSVEFTVHLDQCILRRLP